MKRFNLILISTLVLMIMTPQLWASSAGPGMQPDEAVKMLKDGNARYSTSSPARPHQDQQQRSLTSAQGQHPFATVLSCSDSRAPVEIVFDAGIGDIFVIRVAGNVAAVDEIGSIEYAVDHLGTPVLVVLGHTKCGAVTAVVNKAELHGNIAKLVSHITPAVAKAKKGHPELSGDAIINDAIKANVWQAIADVFKASPITANKVKEGKLKIIGAIYDIETGSVNWMGQHPEQERLIGKYASAPSGKQSKKAH